MDLETISNMVVSSLEECSDFQNVELQSPGLIFAQLLDKESGENRDFEIKIEEF